MPEVKLDLEPQRVVFDQGIGGQGQVVAEQQHLGAAPGLQVGLHDDDDIQPLGEVPVPRLRLQVQKAQAGERLVVNRRKKIPKPCVSLPDLVTTTSSPVSSQTRFAPAKGCLTSCQRNAG